MRKFLLAIITCLVIANSFAQEQKLKPEKIKLIENLDSIIHNTKQFRLSTLSKDTTDDALLHIFSKINIKETEIKSLKNQRVAFKENVKEFLVQNADSNMLKLYTILELENPALNTDTLTFYLEQAHSYESVYALYKQLNNKINELEEYNPDVIYIGGLKRNLEVIKSHMNHLLDYNYCQYSYINTSKKLIKGVYIYIDNDLFGTANYDMNYTGGGGIEITTDLLKMRLLQLVNNDKILAYQGVFLRTEAYTPYIRNTNIFNTDTSFDVNDRPFASYQYIGRSKYRMHYNGHMRMRSDFKLGVIGGDLGNVVQSVIHRDQNVAAVKPYGWDSQIADGGRFAWNIDHYFEIMAFSGQGDIFTVSRKVPSWINIPFTADLHFGNDLTAVGAGIGFSTLSFKQRSGNDDLKLKAGRNFNWVISANIRYRYVIHNSMLEGLGLIETFDDDDDPLAPKDMYRLEKDEVQRNLLMGDVFLGARFIKTTIFYKWTFNTREYDKSKAKDFYTWGRIGLNYIF